MNVQGLRFETGEAIRNGDEFLAQTLRYVTELLKPHNYDALTGRGWPASPVCIAVSLPFQLPVRGLR